MFFRRTYRIFSGPSLLRVGTLFHADDFSLTTPVNLGPGHPVSPLAGDSGPEESFFHGDSLRPLSRGFVELAFNHACFGDIMTKLFIMQYYSNETGEWQPPVLKDGDDCDRLLVVKSYPGSGWHVVGVLETGAAAHGKFALAS